jgi:UDP-3-O-[3-hydroxymyristoyl] glucosamine N-acyltransferase
MGAADVSPLAWVSPTAQLGEGVVVMPGAWIGPGAVIGDGTVIEANAVVGYHTGEGDKPAVVGRRCLIATGATIYHSTTLGDGVKVRHNAVVREHVSVGDRTSLGSGSGVEPHSSIGSDCSLHCRVHVTDYSSIGDLVFIGPGFVSMSDEILDYRRPQLHRGYKGVTIGRAARIGGAVVALPGAVVGEETVVGACSQIRGVLPDRTVCLGSPARPVRRVTAGEAIPAP